MNLMKRCIIAIAMVAILAVMGGDNDGQSLSLTIMHVNDTHSYAASVSGEKLTIDGTST